MTRVIVIEDEYLLRKAVIDILRSEGFSVETAANGQEGIALVKASIPHLVLCDIGLPEMDGYSVLQAVRSDRRTATIPFVFMSGRDAREDIRSGMDLGADDYIIKPFTPTELLSAVDARLRRHDDLSSQLDTLRHNIIHALPHELRTPLTIIMGYAQMFSMEHKNLEPDVILEWADRITASSKRLEKLIENYLVYAQIELIMSSPDELEALRAETISDATHFITHVASQIAKTRDRSIDLQLNVEELGFPIVQENMEKIVFELVDNAFKFSTRGTPVEIGTTKDGPYHVFYVSDHGHGMTNEQIKRVGAYMQFERAIYEQQGLGFGLVLARRLAELHGAELYIQSAVGEGTIATIYFPMKRE